MGNKKKMVRLAEVLTDLLQKCAAARLPEIFRDISSSCQTNKGFSCRGMGSLLVKYLLRRSGIERKSCFINTFTRFTKMSGVIRHC